MTISPLSVQLGSEARSGLTARLATKLRTLPPSVRWSGLPLAAAAILFGGLAGLATLGSQAPKLEAVADTQTLRLARGSIRYQDSGGSGPALVFLHGFNNQLSAWNQVWPHLTGCGRVIRIDIPGYGGSVWPAESYGIPEQSRRIVAFLDALGLAKVTLVGASMGGSIAAWMAAQNPDRVRALLLAAPSGYPDSLQYGGRLRRLYKSGGPNRLASNAASTQLYQQLFPRSTVLHALTVTDSYGERWAGALSGIRAPTLLLWSRGDRAVPFEFAEPVARAIPNCALIPVATQAGHKLTTHRAELLAQLACRLHRGQAIEHIVSELTPTLQAQGDG